LLPRPRDGSKGIEECVSQLTTVVLVIGLSLGMLQGCFLLLGAGIGTGIRNVDPKPPKPETEANCQSWECWDGYACGPCAEGAVADKAPKSK
jgi:hypothetical protein